MACFEQKSLDTLVSTLLSACEKSLKNPDIVRVLERNATQYRRINHGTLLTSTVAADIGQKWFIQMKTNSELKRLIKLLCYYQIPYPKATTFNALCSGLLLISDITTQKLKAKELATILDYGMADHAFAMQLACQLQKILPFTVLKSNAMCIRPKFYKVDETHVPSSLEYQFQRITTEYMPWLAESFTAMGCCPILDKGDDSASASQEKTHAQKVFNYSVEGGMNEQQAEAMLDAILVAEDIVCIGENWFNFSIGPGHCRNKDVISKDGERQKAVAQMISQMYDLKALDEEHAEQAKGKTRDFFENVFGKSILESIHNQFCEGAPVQLRIFSDPDNGDESSSGVGETVAGEARCRECHLIPLSTGTKYKEDSDIEYTQDLTAEENRAARKAAREAKRAAKAKGASTDGISASTTKSVYKSRKQQSEDNFFTQLSAENDCLNRMVIRLRVDNVTADLTKDATLGRKIYVANRFELALTLIHELMHTYYLMVDFYYSDLSSLLTCTADSATGKLQYSGLSLGMINDGRKVSMDSRVSKTNYPKDSRFDISKYHWQINNVDNYTILLAKLYFMDEDLIKLRYKNGDEEASKDKETLATMRLCALTRYRDFAVSGQLITKPYREENIALLSKLEEACWARNDKTYDSIIEMAKKTNEISKRFNP